MNDLCILNQLQTLTCIEAHIGQSGKIDNLVVLLTIVIHGIDFLYSLEAFLSKNNWCVIENV